MSFDGSYDVAKAIYTALAGDSQVSGYVSGRIYDAPPYSDPTYPFISLNSHSIQEWGADDFSGSEHTIDVHVWSRAEDSKEVRQLTDEVRVALHNASLSVTNHVLVNLRFVSSVPLRESDGQTWLGIVTFRAVTTYTS